jgi:hypothetical protein
MKVSLVVWEWEAGMSAMYFYRVCSHCTTLLMWPVLCSFIPFSHRPRVPNHVSL